MCTSLTRVMTSSRIVGMTKKKIAPSAIIGIQKSRAWMSWRRSVRATVRTARQSMRRRREVLAGGSMATAVIVSPVMPRTDL